MYTIHFWLILNTIIKKCLHLLVDRFFELILKLFLLLDFIIHLSRLCVWRSWPSRAIILIYSYHCCLLGGGYVLSLKIHLKNYSCHIFCNYLSKQPIQQNTMSTCLSSTKTKKKIREKISQIHQYRIQK